MARELQDKGIGMEAIRVMIGKQCATTREGNDERRMEAAMRTQQKLKGRAIVRFRVDWNARQVFGVLSLSPSLGVEALLMPLGASCNSRPSVIPRPPSPAMGRWSIWAAAEVNSHRVLPNNAVVRYSAGFE